jgi:hypothetical protein
MTAYRHTRQSRLAEVGEEGQARLARAAIAVRGDGFAGAVEARYLAGAGVGIVRVAEAAHEAAARAVDPTVTIERAGASGDSRATPLDVLSLEPAAGDVALGAWRALDSLRSTIGLGGRS